MKKMIIYLFTPILILSKGYREVYSLYPLCMMGCTFGYILAISGLLLELGIVLKIIQLH
jgi:hypothetical protein